MLKKGDIDKFYKDVEKLDLKFPVAVISEETGHSKANVSKYLSRKLEPSAAFLSAFYDKFQFDSNNVSRENGNDLISEVNNLMNWKIEAEETIKVLRQTTVNILSALPGAKSAALISAELDEAIEMAVNRRKGQKRR